jgi:site-specific DNA-methyltransferase (adenine-specific)
MPVRGHYPCPVPKPFYDDGRVTIYCGDCLRVLPFIPAATVVLTDPPYNLGIDYGTGTDERPDYPAWCARWLTECRRIAGRVALTPGVANIGLWHRLGDDPDWIIAWHKPAAMGRCHVGFNNWEPVLLWGNVAKQSADVVVAPLVPDADLDWHPCPKPIKWATGLLAILSEPGDLVVDPFMGSGTTMRAARDLGRRYIGIEASEAFCARAIRRLDQGVFDFEEAS